MRRLLLHLYFSHAALVSGTAAAVARPGEKEYCLIQAASPNFRRAAPAVFEAGSRPKESLAALDATRWQPAEWFGGFHEGESTYDQDAVEQESALPEPAAEPTSGSPPWIPDVLQASGMSSEWFDESKSGGSNQAWQTHFPAVEDVLSANPLGSMLSPWERQTGGAWRQAFKTEQAAMRALDDSDKKEAQWFDASVSHYDPFGRVREPSTHSGRRYLDWELRSRNVSFACGPPGCTANATLDVYDPATEQARHCRLHVGLHATDYDDEFSREFLEFFMVNGIIVNTMCDPMAKECNNSIPAAQRPLYPCLENYPLHTILRPDNGIMNVSGKISPMVDECPVDGNMLSGIATATCFVRPKPSTPAPLLAVTPAPSELGENGTSPLQCTTPGCVANATVLLHPDLIVNKTCLLTVRIFQTDFDGEHGSLEEVEWVNVSKENVALNRKPGRNPCKEHAAGTLAEDDNVEPFILVDARDVTDDAMDGAVSVTAKISDMVDECGSDGFLLNGEAEVDCD